MLLYPENKNVANHMYKDHVNKVVNLNNVTTASVKREAYYPDNEGIPVVRFDFIDGSSHDWYFDKGQEKQAETTLNSFMNKASRYKAVTNARATTHGASKTTEYVSWKEMRGRCNNPNKKEYSYYGGGGIKVCERWNDFSLFLSDMGPKPDKTYTIDRINPDGDYTPENCRWATMAEQQRNIKNNIWIEIGGERKILTDWCRINGIKPNTARYRINHGWDKVRAVTEIPEKKPKKKE